MSAEQIVAQAHACRQSKEQPESQTMCADSQEITKSPTPFKTYPSETYLIGPQEIPESPPPPHHLQVHRSGQSSLVPVLVLVQRARLQHDEAKVAVERGNTLARAPMTLVSVNQLMLAYILVYTFSPSPRSMCW